MAHPLSTKLDSTLRYASGLYGIATSVLAAITQAAADAATALSTANSASTAATNATTTANAASTAAGTATTTANAASTAAGTATTTANAASTAAGTATTTANTAASNLAAHVGTGGTAHAAATASAAGFATAAQITKLESLAAGQFGTVGRLTVDSILETPTSIAYAAAQTIDTSVKNDWAIGALTGNITISFSNTGIGRQGMIAVRQDATGGRTVSFTPPGSWTLYRDAGTPNLAAASGANAVTIYTYAFVSVGGVNALFIGKLTPVAA